MAGEAFSRARVYDPVLRILHACNALAILLLVATSLAAAALEFTPEAVSLWHLHVWCGYALALGLAARFAWGLHGPEHASLAVFWQWRVWWAAMRARRWFTEPEGYGHHPLAAGVYLAFYLVVLILLATGLALAAIEQGRGPLVQWLGHDVASKALFKRPHDVLEEFVWGFIALHLAALMLHESRHGVPMAQAMISGYQYRKEKS